MFIVLIALLIKWNQQMQLIWYCTNVNAEIGPEPILCINACIAIDTILNFDGDADTYVRCEQAFR